MSATLVAEAPEQTKTLADALPGAILGTTSDDTQKAYLVAADKILDVLTHLRDKESYDFLSGVTSVDYQGYNGKQRKGISERFDVVYHLFSTKKGGAPVVLHVPVPSNDTVASATGVFPGANLQEREVYDLYGIKFAGHPNLRRILLWDGFNGHPMRKDWKEAYFDEDVKPFRSRHPKGSYQFHEDKLPWGKNTTYPAGWDPDTWEAAVAYVPVSQAPKHSPGASLDTESIVVNLGPTTPAPTASSVCSPASKARRFWLWSRRWGICIAITRRLASATPI